MRKRKNKVSKIKICPSFVVLIVLSLVLRRGGILINYLLALSFHELFHLLAATSKGYKLNKFRLDIFGASIDLDEYVDDKDSFMINLAGPMGNIFLCILCFAFYYLVPSSYVVLNKFCMANLVIAVFNLLPIYPLDGGKVFGSFFRNEKKRKLFDIIVKLGIILLALAMFIVGLFYGRFSVVALLMILFVLTSKSETKYALALFKNKDFKLIQSVSILRVNEDDSIINALKRVSKNSYTIFYLDRSKKFYDEDYLIELALKYGSDKSFKDIILS